MSVVSHSYGGLGGGMDGGWWWLVRMQNKAKRAWSHIERYWSTS